MYTNLIPIFVGVEKLFLKDSRFTQIKSYDENVEEREVLIVKILKITEVKEIIVVHMRTD